LSFLGVRAQEVLRPKDVTSVHPREKLNLSLEAVLDELHLCLIVCIVLTARSLLEKAVKVVWTNNLREPLWPVGSLLVLKEQDVLSNEMLTLALECVKCDLRTRAGVPTLCRRE